MKINREHDKENRKPKSVFQFFSVRLFFGGPGGSGCPRLVSFCVFPFPLLLRTVTHPACGTFFVRRGSTSLLPQFHSASFKFYKVSDFYVLLSRVSDGNVARGRGRGGGGGGLFSSFFVLSGRQIKACEHSNNR